MVPPLCQKWLSLPISVKVYLKKMAFLYFLSQFHEVTFYTKCWLFQTKNPPLSLILTYLTVVFSQFYSNIILTLFRPGFFYCLKVQGGSLGTLLMISGTIKASPMKLCTVIVLLKTYQNTEIFENMTYDVTMTSLLKTIAKFGPLRNQTNYHSKGNDDSFPKM